jgi:hypothetical protein
MTAGSTQGGEMAEDFPLAGRAAAYSSSCWKSSAPSARARWERWCCPARQGPAKPRSWNSSWTTAGRRPVASASCPPWGTTGRRSSPWQATPSSCVTLPLRSAKDYDGSPALRRRARRLPDPRPSVNYAATLSTHLEGLQTHGSVVVAVDDVHKLDVESLRILTFVMRRLHDKRVLFLLTLNPV